jgi:serine/threonine-protein kinase
MLIGRKFGPFVIDKELGCGAMGTVYRATYEKTGQHVALKVMIPGLSGSEQAQARFEREGEILKQLNHPHIVRLFGVGRSHGMRYYAMEYIKGEPLDKVMQRRGRMTWEEVATIGRQLCAALQHAHEKGIIHRDLKPSNLMMLPDGTLKLTDFGIAKDVDVTQLTGANCTVGTAAYMSPEQCRGDKDLSFKSDLYSLGVVFYELLTGQKPFKAEVPMDMFLQHIKGTFERPSRLALEVPIWFDTLVCQLLEKKPEKRPRDAAAVGEALDRIAEKVTAQKSAGVELVTARAIDRPAGARLDERERETARDLHQAVTGKRLKRRRVPIYQRGWFIFLGAGLIVALMGVLLYIAIKPDSPDTLYQKAEKLMASANPEDWDRARDGPIKEYLTRYWRLEDEKSAQIHQWADQYDINLRERQLANRMKLNLEPQNGAERNASAAISHEEAGDLEAARRSWEKVSRAVEDEGLERSWTLLAQKHLADLKSVDDRLTQWRAAVEEARRRGREVPTSDETEQWVVRAIRLELFGDQQAAFAAWAEVRLRTSENKTDRRFWTLLNARMAREQKEFTPMYRGKDGQAEWLKDRLAKAAMLDPREAMKFYQDVVVLYGKDSKLADIAQEAQQQLDRLTGKVSQ